MMDNLPANPDNRPPSSVKPSHRGVALVVDDERANRSLLDALLTSEGFQVRHAENGEQAVAMFAAERADIIFMDVMMPVMDGYQATHRIKAAAGDEFVPIIFLTALDNQEVMTRCIDAGGDDFLGKPFNIMVLKARIQAAERVRDLHRKLAAHSATLAKLLEQNQQEQKLAEQIFSRMVESNAITGRIAILQRAANIFSGDLVLTHCQADGALRILVGDFTGHGLVAAIAALPVVNIFQAMTRDEMGDEAILQEINRCLYGLLPADRFMCACLVNVHPGCREVTVWNCGMPSVQLLAATGRRSLPSRAIPLGINPECALEHVAQHLLLLDSERLLLLSDGFTEARDAMGQMLGEATLVGLLDSLSVDAELTPRLEQLLNEHCQEIPQRDDITVVEVCAGPGFLERHPPSCC